MFDFASQVAESNEVKIRCRYCDIRESCARRESKEKYEDAGWITKCAVTPNRPGKRKRK